MKGATQGVYEVLNYLMEGREFVYSEKDLYENAGVSKRDTALALKVLPRLGLVSKTKDTYKFRKQTPAGKVFLKFHDAVLNEICETYGLSRPKVLAFLKNSRKKTVQVRKTKEDYEV